MQGQDSILKSVYCNYRGRVTVYDVHGQKVHELSGMLDYDKYLEIERRTDPEITQFEGLEDYRCIACELKKKKSDTEDELNQSSPLLGIGGLASVVPNISAAGIPRNIGGGVSNNINSGYTSPLPRIARAPRMPIPIPMPIPATGPNSVVNNNSSGVRPKTPSVGSYATTPPPMNVDVDDNHQPLPEKTNKEDYKDKRIENRWWKRIFK